MNNRTGVTSATLHNIVCRRRFEFVLFVEIVILYVTAENQKTFPINSKFNNEIYRKFCIAPFFRPTQISLLLKCPVPNKKPPASESHKTIR